MSSTFRDEPPDRTLLTFVLVVVAFGVVVASCAGGVAGLQRLYGRPPGPDVGSSSLVAARTEAARLVAAASGAITPAGSEPIDSAQYDACFRGSREFMRWDRFSWRCASRHTAVRSVALTSLPTAIREAQADLISAGWHKEYDYLDQEMTDRVLADPTVTPRPSPSIAPLDGIVQAAGYSFEGTRVDLGFGRPAPGFVASCLRFQEVQIESVTRPYWVRKGPVLRTGRLYAVGPSTLLLTVTAQRTWFSR
ncbi:hypothetical protein [Cryptosporangium phraense]|uniref:Uncharacterized protein n=1 Tax=Cryptosporangium phraense TaxID=2593070 RepID=A0A545AN03_9ACTN|nr:hypothetical protein [Cryptosporangium phraense]TQS42663.1 hypothetical protein FL583_23535 [Cryptosporangium phraense]